MENEFIKPDKKKKKKKGKWRLNWRELTVDKFVDLVMLILGVYIAFQLNNWQVESAEKNLEKFYLEDMLVDLDKDIREINDNLNSLRYDRNALVEYLKNGTTLPVDSLGSVVRNVLSLETFTYNQNTYQTVVAGNGITNFHNLEIRRSMTEYYNLYTPILRFEEVYTTALFKVSEYFNASVDFETKKVTDPSIVNEQGTRNLLLLIDGQLEDGIEAYEDALEKAETLKGKIQAVF